MKFDSNLAWKEASAAIAANREVLLSLAGVFFLLPGLAFSLLMPSPPPQPGATPQQAIMIAQAYYASALPFMIPIAILQAVGVLSLLALFTDRTRPTVAEAIKLGFVCVLSYVGVQLLMSFGLTIVSALLLALAMTSGLKVAINVVLGLCFVAGLYVSVKTSLAAPAIVVEGVRSPVKALRRSWRLTKGNSVRLGLFYLLLFVAFAVILLAVMALSGLITTAIAGAEAAKVIGAVIYSGLFALMMLYFVAAMASAHRQLAGPSPDKVSETFE